MKENETLKINPLPSKTWYWLHLNDTTVKWNGDVQPCMVMAEEPEQVSEAGLNIKEMTTGAGAEADTLFSDENLPVLQLTAKAEDGERIIRLDISGEDKGNAAGTVYITAEENAENKTLDIITLNINTTTTNNKNSENNTTEQNQTIQQQNSTNKDKATTTIRRLPKAGKNNIIYIIAGVVFIILITLIGIKLKKSNNYHN